MPNNVTVDEISRELVSLGAHPPSTRIGTLLYYGIKHPDFNWTKPRGERWFMPKDEADEFIAWFLSEPERTTAGKEANLKAYRSRLRERERRAQQRQGKNNRSAEVREERSENFIEQNRLNDLIGHDNAIYWGAANGDRSPEAQAERKLRMEDWRFEVKKLQERIGALQHYVNTGEWRDGHAPITPLEVPDYRVKGIPGQRVPIDTGEDTPQEVEEPLEEDEPEVLEPEQKIIDVTGARWEWSTRHKDILEPVDYLNPQDVITLNLWIRPRGPRKGTGKVRCISRSDYAGATIDFGDIELALIQGRRDFYTVDLTVEQVAEIKGE